MNEMLVVVVEGSTLYHLVEAHQDGPNSWYMPPCKCTVRYNHCRTLCDMHMPPDSIYLPGEAVANCLECIMENLSDVPAQEVEDRIPTHG